MEMLGMARGLLARFFALSATTVMACASARPPASEDRAHAMHEIAAMAEEDQAIQFDLVKNPDDDGHNSRIDALFRKNTARLKPILRAHGWPQMRRDGEEVAKGAFLLVQHADADVAFQREVLPRLGRAAEAGDAKREWVALLTDRVRVNDGRPQVYGTQMTHDANGLAIPKPIEDEANVDRRRAAMGMPDLGTALERHRAFERELTERMRGETDAGAP
jgi:hypothetical protein